MPTGEDQREVLNMPEINSIKEMARNGQSVAGIARELSVDEKTVQEVPEAGRLLAAPA